MAIMYQSESLTQEPGADEITKFETSSGLKSERSATGALEDAVITGSLQSPYESFGLPERLNTRAQAFDKPILQSLKP